MAERNLVERLVISLIIKCNIWSDALDSKKLFAFTNNATKTYWNVNLTVIFEALGIKEILYDADLHYGWHLGLLSRSSRVGEIRVGSWLSNFLQIDHSEKGDLARIEWYCFQRSFPHLKGYCAPCDIYIQVFFLAYWVCFESANYHNHT